ncbi:MAG: sugar phosphate isomerase/epimerase [Chloroflexi bacterium]|nr:sugar phosphate isomerase/epimerase [Chloroflexota bacterium]
MRIGLCGSVQSIMAQPDFPFQALDYMEEGVQRYLKPEAPEAEFIENLRAFEKCPLPVEAANVFLPADLKCVGPVIDHERLARYVQTAMARAGQAQIKIIVFGSGRSRFVPEGFSREAAFAQLTTALKQWGEWAAPYGVTFAIEPLNTAECNIITSVAEGAALAKSVNHPNVKLLADIYHMTRENEPAGNIEDAGPLLVHAHVAENAAHTPPGVAGDDFHPYLRAFHRAGYPARLSLECNWQDLAGQLGPSVAYLRRQLQEVGYK